MKKNSCLIPYSNLDNNYNHFYFWYWKDTWFGAYSMPVFQKRLKGKKSGVYEKVGTLFL